MGKITPDTNIMILGLTKKEPYATWLRSLIETRTLTLSVIVIAEFLAKATKNEENAFRELLKIFPVLPIDLETAEVSARFRKTFLRSKKKLILPDCLLAATCYVQNTILLTNNKRDFPIKEISVIDRI